MFVEIIQHKGEVAFSGEVLPNERFTFEGLDKKGTLSPKINIYVDEVLHTEVHTSCSVEVGPGYVSGDFEVIEGYSRNGGKLCPLEPGDDDEDDDDDDDTEGDDDDEPTETCGSDGNADDGACG